MSSAVRRPARRWFVVPVAVFCVVLLGGLQPLSAQGEALSEQDLADPEALAARLGLEAGVEAVLGFRWTGRLDSAQVGLRRLDLPEAADGQVGVFLVRDLTEGIVPVSVVSGRTSWEGSVRVYRGTVTPLDLDRMLASPDAVEVPVLVEEGDVGFDLFAFYDSLDVIDSGRGRQDHCLSVADGLPDGPDRRLVEQTCKRIERQNAVDDPDSVDLADEALLDDPDLLASSLVVSTVDERSIYRKQSVLYRRDGTRRRLPQGTLVRGVVIGVGIAGVLAGTVAAVKWEERAQQEYVLARAAERVGDDVERTRRLFYTRGFDRQRDLAIGLGAVSLSSAVVAAIFQKLELQRLQRARSALDGGADGS